MSLNRLHRLPFAVSSSLLLAACATNADRYDRAFVSAKVDDRTGQGLGPGAPPGESVMPPGVDVDDGVSEDEAVAIALWNNAAFQEALAELGVRRADLIEAGLWTNPRFLYLFPLGPKQIEYALTWPIEAIWQQPARVAAAELECERVAELLCQGGLDLVRDVRSAASDLALARRRAGLAAETAAVRARAETYFATQLRLGEVSELAASDARVASLRAEQEAARLAREVEVSAERLRALLGTGADDRHLDFRVDLGALDERAPPDAGDPTDDIDPDPAALVRRALAMRADLRAAEMSVEAAGERAGLAPWEILKLSLILDANDEGKDGSEAGPGVSIEVPIFDQGQGRNARADAELERAARHYVTVRDAIALEVVEARARFRQAQASLAAWRLRILPAMQLARAQAERAHAAGETSVLPVLESEVRLFDAQAQAAAAAADLRRARAQLERSVGGRLERPAEHAAPKHAGGSDG